MARNNDDVTANNPEMLVPVVRRMRVFENGGSGKSKTLELPARVTRMRFGIFHIGRCFDFRCMVSEIILTWRLNIVLADGPPLYLARLTSTQRRLAWENGLHLAREVDTLILDHHLLLDESGLRWLEHLSSSSGIRIL